MPSNLWNVLTKLNGLIGKNAGMAADFPNPGKKGEKIGLLVRRGGVRVDQRLFLYYTEFEKGKKHTLLPSGEGKETSLFGKNDRLNSFRGSGDGLDLAGAGIEEWYWGKSLLLGGLTAGVRKRGGGNIWAGQITTSRVRRRGRGRCCKITFKTRETESSLQIRGVDYVNLDGEERTSNNTLREN